MVFSDKGLENQMEEFAQPLEKQCMASEGGIGSQSLASRLCRANADFPVIDMTEGYALRSLASPRRQARTVFPALGTMRVNEYT